METGEEELQPVSREMTEEEWQLIQEAFRGQTNIFTRKEAYRLKGLEINDEDFFDDEGSSELADPNVIRQALPELAHLPDEILEEFPLDRLEQMTRKSLFPPDEVLDQIPDELVDEAWEKVPEELTEEALRKIPEAILKALPKAPEGVTPEALLDELMRELPEDGIPEEFLEELKMDEEEEEDEKEEEEDEEERKLEEEAERETEEVEVSVYELEEQVEVIKVGEKERKAEEERRAKEAEKPEEFPIPYPFARKIKQKKVKKKKEPAPEAEGEEKPEEAEKEEKKEEKEEEEEEEEEVKKGSKEDISFSLAEVSESTIDMETTEESPHPEESEGSWTEMTSDVPLAALKGTKRTKVVPAKRPFWRGYKFKVPPPNRYPTIDEDLKERFLPKDEPWVFERMRFDEDVLFEEPNERDYELIDPSRVPLESLNELEVFMRGEKVWRLKGDRESQRRWNERYLQRLETKQKSYYMKV
uniref:Uncharacterized protein n=1 Tax=Arcella intermedia TaxID=1963864 RepID=A0A6B2L201_9EUKA|eukprot:TRINITY_DN2731_c0_g1_i1.p1 TRINITY_DN2731_c0_g1~~TRINITY_DN2731_c0_g1_i1.p1  ORF type:complete len:473 (+),score=168.53 TRINITY_DN2731_c0_g1_i1:291-1709(+)